MTDINPGDLVRVSNAPGFKDAAGVLADPTTVRLKWRRFDAVTTWVFGTDAEVVKDAVGLYHADIPVTDVGMHYFRWEGEGAVVAAEEGSFFVSSNFPVASP